MKKILFACMALMLAFTSCQQSTGSDEVGVSPTPPAPTTEATEYTVTVTQPDFGGTVSVDKAKAKASETVTITTTANDGFELETVSVKNGEATVTVTDKKFTMPSGNVTVNATFAASSYTVKWDNGHFENKFSLAKVKAYITQIGLVETTDYSIDKKNGVLTFTSAGYAKVAAYLNTKGEPTVTETPPTPTTDGGEDNGIGEPPATANEYTVSVASGIKGGHIEVSLDNATWTTLSTSTKYAKNTKLYVHAVADKHYKYSSGIDESVITITENKTLNATFEIVKETLGSVIVTPTLEVNQDLLSSKYIVEIQIVNDKFNAGWNKAKIALGFDEDYYYGLTETSLAGGPKYYYAYPTEISTFKDSKTNTMKVVYISINGENFEIPDVGKLYLALENNNQTALYAMTKPNSTKPNYFKVIVE